MPQPCHHTQQLRLKHLKTGELFRFTYDIRTSPWTKRDGTPGETTIVFAKGQTYKKISPRKIQAIDAWLSTVTSKTHHMLIGRPSRLGKGQGELPVDTSDRKYLSVV